MPRLVLFCWMVCMGLAEADGGRVLGEREVHGLRVVLFAQPDPLRAGPVDFGVYLETEGAPALDAVVGFRLIKLSAPSPETAWRGPGCVTPGVSVPAVLGHAGNKLVYSAMLGIPEAGLWELAVDIRCGEQFSTVVFKVSVLSPAPPLIDWWPMVLMFPAGVLVYVWRARILRKRKGRA